jgi:hypothetical protein
MPSQMQKDRILKFSGIEKAMSQHSDTATCGLVVQEQYNFYLNLNQSLMPSEGVADKD